MDNKCRKTILVLFLVLFGVLFFAESSLAAVLNVPAQYATIQLAVDAAQPGDTILLAAGTYNETVQTKRSGTSASRITLDGQNVATLKGIKLSHEYITVQNLTFTGTSPQDSRWVQFLHGAHYIIFQNNVIDGNGQDAYAFWWELPHTFPWGTGEVASRCTITNNEIKNTRHMPVMFIGGEYNTVSNNYFHDGQRVESWVRFFGRYNTFTQNTFANNIHTPWTDGHPDTFETGIYGVGGCVGAYNIVFNRNFIYNSSGDAQNIMLDVKGDPYHTNIYFLNNIFVQSGTYDSLMSPNTYLFNNIFYNHLDPDRGGVGRSFGCREYTTDSCTGEPGTICADGSKAYNNIFLDGGTGGGTPDQTGYYFFRPHTLTDVVADYNYVAKELSGVPYSAMAEDPLHQAVGDPGGWDDWNWWEPNGMNGGNPYMVNEFHGCTHETCNLRLTENTPSKIRDGGMDLTSLWPSWIPLEDYDGNPRPSGSGWSIGAFEYQAAPLQTCSQLSGTCCSSGQSCLGGSFQPSSDCGSLCCVGMCQTPVCGDGSCNGAETCSTCPADCACTSGICCSGSCITPACTQAGDCGSNPCMTYTCSNPGTCSAYCSSIPKTACINGDSCCPAGCTNYTDSDCPSITPGLVLGYHFDEGSGLTANDFSGNGNTGTISGAAWTAGKSGGGLSFDGVNDYVDAGSPASLDDIEAQGGGGMTVSTWIYNRADPQAGYPKVIVGKAPEGTGYWGFEVLSSLRLGFWKDYATNDLNTLSATNSYSLNAWHHVAVTWNGNPASSTDVKFYVDGSLKGHSYDQDGTSVKVSDSVLNLYISRNYYGGTTPPNAYFNGTIDEVRIYNRVLSPQEISDLYSQTSCIHKSDLPPCDGCVSDPELLTFIDRWRVNNLDVTLKELIEAIGLWKEGC